MRNSYHAERISVIYAFYFQQLRKISRLVNIKFKYYALVESKKHSTRTEIDYTKLPA